MKIGRVPTAFTAKPFGHCKMQHFRLNYVFKFLLLVFALKFRMINKN